MKSELRRRIEQIEDQFPTATAIADHRAGDTAFAKAVAFVEEHGGRMDGESLASAVARIMGMTTAALMASLSDNSCSRYQSGGCAGVDRLSHDKQIRKVRP